MQNGSVFTRYLYKNCNLLEKYKNLSLDKLESISTKDINNDFVTFFERDNFFQLNEMIKSWSQNKYFIERMKFFEQSLELLKLPLLDNKLPKINPSNFIIPVLISQIDGISLKVALDLGCVIDHDGYLVNEKTGGRLSKWKTQPSLPLNSFHDIKAFELMDEILFAKARTNEYLSKNLAESAEDSFNRHKILHGENIDYGRIEGVISLFIILDYLANLRIE